MRGAGVSMRGAGVSMCGVGVAMCDAGISMRAASARGAAISARGAGVSSLAVCTRGAGGATRAAISITGAIPLPWLEPWVLSIFCRRTLVARAVLGPLTSGTTLSARSPTVFSAGRSDPIDSGARRI